MTIRFSIPVSKKELSLDITLQSGQSFRWVSLSKTKWRGVIRNLLWTLEQQGDELHCCLHNEKHIGKSSSYLLKELKPEENKLDSYKRIIVQYFNLDKSLQSLYHKWSISDENFSNVCKDVVGVRLLSQDPIENVFSFICSSNNNIQRITKLVEKMCVEYGKSIMMLDDIQWYEFPSVSALANEDMENQLRKHGFGYRAKFIHKSAQMILENGAEDWLFGLRKLSYPECHSELKKLPGVGAKVADCICLMSMGHYSAIPVDTHVFQVAARDYLPHLLKTKSLTEKVYQEIAHHFRTLYGEHAGWAQSVLFTADLKKFKNPEIQKSKRRKMDR